jgi:hypothetical protein
MKKHPSIFTISRISALLGFFALAPATGCDGSHGGQNPAVEEDGQALLTLGTIPDDIACVIVTIAGEFRTADHQLDVVPGDEVSEALTKLPVGPVVFSAYAYSQACTSVTKSTAPMWISDDKDVTLVQGKSSSVTLTLFKNGRAKVTVKFADQEDGGTDAGSLDGGTSD